MSIDPEISIIIVNYNTTQYLRRCLQSINKSLKNHNVETIVVDNNSLDRNVEKLSDEFSEVFFFFRNENDGFGAGCNFGVKMSKGKYLLFLNPDIILKDDSIIELKNFLEINKNSGIVSGVMLDEKDSVIYFYNDFPSVMWELYHLIGFGYDEKIKKLITRKEIKVNEIFEVDWFHGAFFMIRKEDFDTIYGFNENYFMYYEDIEICFKAKKFLKKKNFCLPYIKVYHHTQSSIKNESMDNIFIFHLQRGKLLFLQNYSFVKRSIIFSIGFLYVLSRIFILPVWNKYKAHKKEKLKQLLKVFKLYLSKSYLYSSKFNYIKS